MNISIVGSGYVETTVAACLADSGYQVVNVDINDGVAPIHEPGLDELLETHGSKRLRATTDYDAIADTEVTFLTLRTPSTDDRSIKLSAMKASARSVGNVLAGKDEYHLVVKSTIIPGTTEGVLAPILADASDGRDGDDFGIASNPEFLREGSAVEDFTDPDKIVFGTDGDKRLLERLWNVNEPIIFEHTRLGNSFLRSLTGQRAVDRTIERRFRVQP